MAGYQLVDGVGNVSVVNGIAYIDLVVTRPPATEGQKGQIEVVQSLAMTMPNFVHLCEEMANHLQRMEQKGMIKRRDAAR